MKREKLCNLDVLPIPMLTMIERAKLARVKADLECKGKANAIPKTESFPENSVKNED